MTTLNNTRPKGGTELQLAHFNKFVDQSLIEKIDLHLSVPEFKAIDPNKPSIIWLKNSYDQPNLYPWFKKRENHTKYDWYVFNTHWSYEKYRQHFNVPHNRCVVIKNGVEDVPRAKLDYKKGDPIRIVHQCTPWRGLSVLLGAMQLVKNPLITLDVYSSTEIYGQKFYETNQATYEPLFEQCRKLPNVNYIGWKPNQEVKNALQNYHMFVYPSIWEETFCISAIECMKAGLYCIVTNYGALFETCAEFPMYVPYDRHYRNLSIKFAAAIEAAAEQLHTNAIKGHLKFQQDYVDQYYNWTKQGASWNMFLKGAIAQYEKNR
jgi:UDP-glucose:(glucosyl)LPS alpha-1,2-glucosyltransferase